MGPDHRTEAKGEGRTLAATDGPNSPVSGLPAQVRLSGRTRVNELYQPREGM